MEQKANLLLEQDKITAYQFLGDLASFKGDINNVHSYYEKALELVKTDDAKKLIVLFDYSACLFDMGFFSKGIELSISAYNIVCNTDPLFPFVFKSIIIRFMRVGLVHRAADLIRKKSNEKYLTNIFNELFGDIRLIFELEKFMDEHGINDELLQRLFEIGISVLHKHKFFNFRSPPLIEFSADEDSKWLCSVIKIDRSVDEIVEMKYELACALAESDLPTELLLNFIVAYEIAGE